jgi:hypothetical protein
MSHFLTLQLDPEGLCEALPLLRLALPGLDELRWVAHCEDLVRAGGGVLAVAAADGAFHGVALYRPQSDLRRGKVLRVDMLVAYELSPAGPVRAALLAALEDTCRNVEARGMVLLVPDTGLGTIGNRKSAPFERAGFRSEAALMWRAADQYREIGTRKRAHLA